MRGFVIGLGLVVVCGAICQAAPTNASKATPEPAACMVAEAALRSQVSKPLAGHQWIVASSPETIPEIKQSLFWNTGWRGKRPSSGLLRNFRKANSQSVIDLCANVRSYLSSAGVLFGDREVDKADAKLKSGAFPPPITSEYNVFSLSFPTMGADGRSALIATGVTCGALCGSGVTQYWTLHEGRWALSGEHGDWIS